MSIATARTAWRSVKRMFRPPLHSPDTTMPFEVYGSAYGGWPVAHGTLTPDSVVYSFGVGEDLSFDLEIVEKFGCVVKAFDPTPRSLSWIARQPLPDSLSFYPVGLSDTTTMLKFSAPARADFVSYTVGQGGKVGERIELPVRALHEIMDDEDDLKIDFLKLDIEGSEYVALRRMLQEKTFPTQLCVEFHHGMFGFEIQQTYDAVSALRAAGYCLYYVSETGRDYGFIHRPAVT